MGKEKKIEKKEVKTEVNKDTTLTYLETKIKLANSLIGLNNSRYNTVEDKDKVMTELIESDVNFMMAIILNYASLSKKQLIRRLVERMMEFGITLSIYPMVAEPIILQKPIPPIKQGDRNYLG